MGRRSETSGIRQNHLLVSVKVVEVIVVGSWLEVKRLGPFWGDGMFAKDDYLT